MPHFARKKDGNHQLITAAFQRYGWTVCHTWRAPYCPDFFAAKGQRVIAVEVKARLQKRTDKQEKFGDGWPGEYYVITSEEDVGLVNRDPIA